MRVYISGRMAGCPDLNRPAFDAAERRLREQGHFVMNPHRISELFGTAEELKKSFVALYGETPFGGSGYSPALARAVLDADLAAVRSCDAIYLLRGWEASRGAKRELAEALAHRLEIMQEGELE